MLFVPFTAVVGRVVKFFGAPLITTGGFTFDFTEKKVECRDEYFMTTRVGNLAFRDIATFFLAIMDRYAALKSYIKIYLLRIIYMILYYECALLKETINDFVINITACYKLIHKLDYRIIKPYLYKISFVCSLSLLATNGVKYIWFIRKMDKVKLPADTRVN